MDVQGSLRGQVPVPVLWEWSMSVSASSCLSGLLPPPHWQHDQSICCQAIWYHAACLGQGGGQRSFVLIASCTYVCCVNSLQPDWQHQPARAITNECTGASMTESDNPVLPGVTYHGCTVSKPVKDLGSSWESRTRRVPAGSPLTRTQFVVFNWQLQLHTRPLYVCVHPAVCMSVAQGWLKHLGTYLKERAPHQMVLPGLDGTFGLSSPHHLQHNPFTQVQHNALNR